MKINTKSSLKSFFDKHGSNNHVMMAVVISHTPDIIKNMIVTFMKSKAEIYKNVYFIIYSVNEDEIGNIGNKFPTKKSDYPYIIYIYDNSEKLLDVTSVTTIKKLRESFNIVEADYVDTTNLKEIPTSQHNSCSDNMLSVSGENTKLPVEKNVKKNMDQFMEQNNDIENDENYLLEENKKMADKILLFMEYKKDYDTVFVKDIQRRKKLEKKNNDSKLTKDKSDEYEQNNKKKNNNSSRKKK